ncbi:hypothetical protein F4778DRAFT_745766 [Xylariomycetidae sp. FL2044]|nr:hypothetical protein F4778DRAFT_745766 [Xylariomycetidae sp. FL2044]
MLYLSDIFFGTTIIFVKLSILSLYYSIFSVSDTFRMWNYIVTGLCVVWFLVYTFLNILQCHPISMLWEAFGFVEYCLPSGVLWLALELTNLTLDVAILVLPITMLGRLNLARAKRWSVAGVFLLGGLVCVASIVRLTHLSGIPTHQKWLTSRTPESCRRSSSERPCSASHFQSTVPCLRLFMGGPGIYTGKRSTKANTGTHRGKRYS